MTSIQSRSAVAKSQAVQAKKAPSDGWNSVPHVNQIWPNGADASYVNGPYNCGASVVAMVARGHGKKPNMTDAQLITHLAQGNTSEKGSTPDDVANMLKRAGVPNPGNSALGGPFDSGRVKDQLKKGRMLIAQVGVKDKKTGEVTSHYIVIKKKTADGKFVISDPLKKKSTIVSAGQLAKAVNGAPPFGGLMIPVGRPGGDLKPKDPPPPVMPQGPADPWAFQYPISLAAYRAQQPFQPYRSENGEIFYPDQNGQYSNQPPESINGRVGYEIQRDGFQSGNVARGYPAINAQQVFDPRQAAAAQRYGAQPYLAGQPSFGRGPAGYSMRDQFTSAQPRYPGMLGGFPPPAPAPKPVPKSTADKNAFTASDDEFKGVNGNFVAQSNTSVSDEKRVTLKVNYQRHGEQVEPPTKQMTPKRLSVKQYVGMLLRAKFRGKEGIDEKLARLELSPFEKDKKVMALIERWERRQGSIGKKLNTESYNG